MAYPDPEWFGTGALVEQAGSPAWQYGDSVTVTTIHRGMYELAKSSAPRKGYLGSGDYAGMVVASATVVREKGGIGLLTVTYEGAPDDQPPGSETLPPDDTEVDYEAVQYPLEQHPTFAILDRETVTAAHVLAEAKDQSEINKTAWLYDIDDNPTVAEYNARTGLAERYSKGVTHFNRNLPVYRYTFYSFSPIEPDAGGYQDFPFGGVVVPGGYDWLRLPDRISKSGSYWKCTFSWQANLNIDPIIYAAT